MSTQVAIRVNGTAREDSVEPRMLLVHFIRDVCGLTGTHVGCETSICGSCTVLVNDRAVKSCTMFAVQADGAHVTTIEGVASERGLHPVQDGFWTCHGLQCGYCTPGMIMTAIDLLAETPAPSRAEIVAGLKGNLCRCTGYTHIIDAVEHAVRSTERGGSPQDGHPR